MIFSEADPTATPEEIAKAIELSKYDGLPTTKEHALLRLMHARFILNPPESFQEAIEADRARTAAAVAAHYSNPNRVCSATRRKGCTCDYCC